MTCSDNIQSGPEKITGRFYKRLFRNDDGSYCVCLYTSKKDTRDIFTVVGHDLPEVSFPVTFCGKWITSEKYGRQFKSEMVENRLPQTNRDIIRFIASLKTGIGEKKAAQMLQMVGEKDFWTELSTDPMQFQSIRGIHLKALVRLQEQVGKMTVQQDLFRLLAGNLLLDSQHLKKICSFFKNEMDQIIPTIQTNPFILMQCGYEFRELDRFASAISDMAPNSPFRLTAAAYQVLFDAKAQSHVGLPEQQVISAMMKLLAEHNGVTSDELLLFLNSATATKELVFSHGLYYLPRSYEEEVLIAELVAKMVKKPPERISGTAFQKAMKDYRDKKGIALSADQESAVWTALTRSLCIITGGPGTGKSTILDALLFCWKKFYDTEWLLMAPTGKAGVRMTETTGQPATTIHAALGLLVGNESAESMDRICNPVSKSLVVIDECSMLDQTVMASVMLSLEAKPLQHVVLVGDPDQLPSVGWGNVLADMIDSQVVPVCRLKTIYRQGAGNPIITNSSKIQNDDANLEFTDSFKAFNQGSDEDNMQAACRFYKRCIRHYGFENVVLLSPYHKKTPICTNELNKHLQEALNPNNGQKQISHFGRVFRTRDRVIQLKNVEGLSNGDVGTIQWVDPTAGDTERILSVKFESGVVREYGRDQLDQLELAYALSIHKSQGSQWKTVIIVLPQNSSPFLRRNLLYTAITRSSENIALFSTPQSIAYAVHNDKHDERYTNLSARLTENMK